MPIIKTKGHSLKHNAKRAGTRLYGEGNFEIVQNGETWDAVQKMDEADQQASDAEAAGNAAQDDSEAFAPPAFLQKDQSTRNAREPLATPSDERRKLKGPIKLEEKPATDRDAVMAIAKKHGFTEDHTAAIAAITEALGMTAPRKPRQQRQDGTKSKRQIAADLLTRPEGTTAAEILEVCGWPSVSVPALAKASGLHLRTVPGSRPLRYHGEPIGAAA